MEICFAYKPRRLQRNRKLKVTYMNAPKKALLYQSFDWETMDMVGLTVQILMNRLLLGFNQGYSKTTLPGPN